MITIKTKGTSKDLQRGRRLQGGQKESEACSLQAQGSGKESETLCDPRERDVRWGRSGKEGWGGGGGRRDGGERGKEREGMERREVEEMLTYYQNLPCFCEVTVL